MNDSRPALLPLKVACQYAGFGPTTAYKLIAAGKLDARKLGGKTLITTASLDALIANLPPANVRRAAA
jgi:excisionase family DNA binding protein